MQYTTKRQVVQQIGIRLSVLVVVSLLVLTLAGRMPDSLAGWGTCAAQVIVVPFRSRRLRRGQRGPDTRSWRWVAWGRYLAHTAPLPLARGLLLGVLWHLSGQRGPAWVLLIPWGAWLWHSGGLLCPWLPHQIEWRGIDGLLWQLQRGVLMGYLALAVGRRLPTRPPASFLSLTPGGAETLPVSWGLALGCLVCQREEPWVEVVIGEDGGTPPPSAGTLPCRWPGMTPFANGCCCSSCAC